MLGGVHLTMCSCGKGGEVVWENRPFRGGEIYLWAERMAIEVLFVHLLLTCLAKR